MSLVRGSLRPEGGERRDGQAHELELRPKTRKHRCRYRPWAELLARTFGLNALACPACRGRMRFVALVRNPRSITRYLSGIGEPTQLRACSTGRGPPYGASTILRRKALGYDDA